MFDAVRRAMHAYTERRDSSLARDVQKTELADVLADINDAFLVELRLNEEFTRILARGTFPYVRMTMLL